MKPYLREKRIRWYWSKKGGADNSFISRRTFKQHVLTDIADDMDICDICGYMMCATDHGMEDNEPDWIYKWIDSYFLD